MARLSEIEEALAIAQNLYEDAAGQRARLVRHWERRLMLSQKTAKGADAYARKAAAFAMAAEQDELYDELMEAEAGFERYRAEVKVLEVRATIGMSILRAQGRA
jgi:hypothetical protein